jgi:hypothetical protein
MNAHKNGVALAVSHGGSLGEGDELVPRPRHDRFESGLLQAAFEAAGDVEIDVLLVDVGVGSPEVGSAMTGVDHHGGKGHRRTRAQREERGQQQKKAGEARLFHGFRETK